MTLRIIGDVHGQVGFVLKRNARCYLELIEDCEYSVQLGDMGDAETYSELTSRVDPRRHRFFAGNHDCYDKLPPHCLGDYGAHELGGVEFFYVRGAQSSDKQKLLERGRQIGRTLWYEQEELPSSLHDDVLAAYVNSQPRMVLTHTCPMQLVPWIYDQVTQKSHYAVTGRSERSATNELLQRLLDAHKPELWCFGHFHHDWCYREDGIEFRCVGELSDLDLTG
jgi:predicted phosphodiesterase